jgi:hypothetical protein
VGGGERDLLSYPLSVLIMSLEVVLVRTSSPCSLRASQHANGNFLVKIDILSDFTNLRKFRSSKSCGSCAWSFESWRVLAENEASVITVRSRKHGT